MEMDTKHIIGKIDNLKFELDTLSPINPEYLKKLIQKVKIDWNFHSSHIEGNSLTYEETKALLLWGTTARGKPLRDHVEIRKHNQAVELLLDLMNGKSIILTEHFIRELHGMILSEEYYINDQTPEGAPTRRKIIPGQYKTMPNHYVNSAGEIFHFTSPEDTQSQVKALVEWYYTESESETFIPLVVAALFHYKFVRIFPFDDGNGRMARLLMNLILIQHGYPPVIINSIKREVYMETLQYSNEDGSGKFIAFIGERLVESLELWIKAAKGESIDEPEDIDKIVRSLKEKLENLSEDDDLKLVLSFETFEAAFNSSIKPFIGYFFNQIIKLAGLFHQSVFQYKIEDDWMRDNEIAETSFNDFLQKCEHVISQKRIRKRIDLHFDLKELKRSGINPFNVSFNFAIEFDDNLYKISSEFYDLPRIKKLYHQKISDNEKRIWINQAIARISNDIDAHLTVLHNSRE